MKPNDRKPRIPAAKRSGAARRLVQVRHVHPTAASGAIARLIP